MFPLLLFAGTRILQSSVHLYPLRMCRGIFPFFPSISWADPPQYRDPSLWLGIGIKLIFSLESEFNYRLGESVLSPQVQSRTLIEMDEYIKIGSTMLFHIQRPRVQMLPYQFDI